MAATHVTSEGEPLDLICWRHYRRAGAAGRVLEANPHIKRLAHRLPAGVEITLPDLDPQSLIAQPVRLWD